MNGFDQEDIIEALRASGTGAWRLEYEPGVPDRFYGDENMNELIGVPDDMDPEERYRIFMSRIYPEDIPIFTAYADALRSTERAEVVYRYMHPTLGTIYVRCGGRVVEDDGNIAVYRGFHQNVNETVRVEQEKRKQVTHQSEIFRKISSKVMENITDVAIYIDLEDGTFQWVRGEEIFDKKIEGYSQLCEIFADYVPEDQRDSLICRLSMQNLKESMKKKETDSFSIYVEDEDGTSHRKTFSYYALDDDCDHILTTLKDTTGDYKREQALADALAQANQSNRAKTVFLNNMSHDIRTPMNAIIGFTDLADKYIRDPEKCKEHLGKIRTSSQHLLMLINDVLEMSRIESGTIEIMESKCSITEIVNELQVILQEEADKKRIHFSVDISDVRDDHVLCDKLRLNQVLLNCASNALKFTEPGGSVSIQVVQGEKLPNGTGGYLFRVRDTGIGMSKDFLEKIFDPFAREESRVHYVQGTGLGMAITKNLVDMMHGTIDIKSEPGKGSQFDFYFRFKLVDDAVGQNRSSDMSTFTLEGKRILLVEDNELNQEIAIEILEEAGAIVEHAENGQLAVDMVKNSEPGYYDTVLMDLQMPVMNGYEAASAIRALDREDTKTLVIVAMTANAFAEDRQKAIAAGMNEHVAKPIDVPVLMSTLARFIK